MDVAGGKLMVHADGNARLMKSLCETFHLLHRALALVQHVMCHCSPLCRDLVMTYLPSVDSAVWFLYNGWYNPTELSLAQETDTSSNRKEVQDPPSAPTGFGVSPSFVMH